MDKICRVILIDILQDLTRRGQSQVVQIDYGLIRPPQAIEDIKAIAEYIGRDSITYAESTVERTC